MANGPKRASNVTKKANRAATYQRSLKKRAANKKLNEIQHGNNLDALTTKSTHIEERAHTTRVFIPANPKVKSSKARYETITTYSQHAERPSKALRRARREQDRREAESVAKAVAQSIEKFGN